ncbi:hypothetical protein MBLNU457_g0068t2 [Dothideomycetes sp. NU457]
MNPTDTVTETKGMTNVLNQTARPLLLETRYLSMTPAGTRRKRYSSAIEKATLRISHMIVGLDVKEKIDREHSSLGEVYVSASSQKLPARSDVSALRYQRPEKERNVKFVKPTPEEQAFDTTNDVVQLSKSKKRKRGSESPYQTNQYDVDYRSIEGKAKPIKRHDESDLESASDSDNNNAAVAEDVLARNRNADLSRKVKDNPSDVDLWLELIEHQVAMVSPGNDLVNFSNAERRTLSDLRLSLFSKAIRLVQDASRADLTQLMLVEGAKIWDRETLLQRIRELLGETPHSAQLWMLYMDTIQSNSTRFRYDEIKEALLDTMKRVHMSSNLLAKKHPIYDIGVHVLLRVTSFIRDAGYTELSIAIWQAIIHAQLIRSTQPASTSSQDLMSDLEQWWDDEGPRFGESGYAEKREAPNEPGEAGSEDQDAAALSPEAPFRSFATIEIVQSTNHQFPGRTTDEDGPDDPFHVVFFSDIWPFIEASIPYDPDALINAYLHFFSLPPIPQRNGPSPSKLNWRRDAFLQIPNPQAYLSSANLTTLLDSTINTSHSITRTLFTPSSFPATLSKPTTAFLTHSLESLLTLHPSPQLREYYLAFTLAYSPSTASKTARRLLKAQPHAIRLWNAAAVIEAKQERYEKAEQIWEGALGLVRRSQTDEGREALENSVGSMIVIQCWTWSFLERGDREGALRRLVRLKGTAHDVERGEVSTAAKLSVQKYLQEIFDSSNSSSFATAESTVLASELLVLLSYLTATNALPAALDFLHAHSAILEQQTSAKAKHARELLHQFEAHLIYHHIQQKQPYKPLVVREKLQDSIRLYPHNSLFLSLYTKIFRYQSRVDESVRRTIRWPMLAEPGKTTIAGWASVAAYEINRFDAQAGSTAENVRAVFQRALKSVGSPVTHAPLLWMLWFQFEQAVFERVMLKGDDMGSKYARKEIATQLERWKAVFLDGLRCLRWCKNWVLAGLAALNREDESGWDLRDLKRVYNVLHERELRVRVEGVEDLVDDLLEAGADDPAR